MAKDHDREAQHPSPKNEGKKRLAVSANDTQKSDAKRVEFDFEKYAQFLENSDLTETQKLEHLGAIWRIMSEFVMLGWGVHPIQQACGQENQSVRSSTNDPNNLIDSNHSHT